MPARERVALGGHFNGTRGLHATQVEKQLHLCIAWLPCPGRQALNIRFQFDSKGCREFLARSAFLRRCRPPYASILPAISLRTLAQTMAVRPEGSRVGLNSTTSAATMSASME